MEIIILGKKIDTKDITEIYDVERDKQRFLNREAGFVIRFMDGSSMIFKEDIPYESYISEISFKKEKWHNLQKQVTAKWESDNHGFPEFGF